MKNINKLSYDNMRYLESESIFIIRELVAETNKPVMLYSLGKDSSVLLHLAKKAFYPEPIPFPLLHIDTTWKFKAMYEFKKKIQQDKKINLITFQNEEAIKKKINPFDHGPLHTEMWKTQGLKKALKKYEFDAAIAGARRDEEVSRAKERIFSFRSKSQAWDPKKQRPEVWDLYNTFKNKGESIRVFPLSNWTELDIWQYIKQENIKISKLYFASSRPTVKRNNQLLVVDDHRFRMNKTEKITYKNVRFRTLGCYPLTAATVSKATNLDEVIKETLSSRFSERNGRLIDKDDSSSLELKKRNGYF